MPATTRSEEAKREMEEFQRELRESYQSQIDSLSKLMNEQSLLVQKQNEKIAELQTQLSNKSEAVIHQTVVTVEAAESSTPLKELLPVLKGLADSLVQPTEAVLKPVMLRSLSHNDILFFLERYEIYAAVSTNPLPIEKFIEAKYLRILPRSEGEEEVCLKTALRERTIFTSWELFKRSLSEVKQDARIRDRQERFEDYYLRFDECLLRAKHFTYDIKKILFMFSNNLNDSSLKSYLNGYISDGLITTLDSLRHYSLTFIKNNPIFTSFNQNTTNNKPAESNAQTTDDKNSNQNLTNRNSTNTLQKLTCFKCGKTGHKSYQCQNKPQQINFFQTDSSTPKCEVKIAQSTFTAIIDSGASLTVMSEDLAEKCKPPMEYDNTTLTTINGTVNCIGVFRDLNIVLKIYQNRSIYIKTNIYVIPGKSILLIGYDVIRRLNLNEVPNNQSFEEDDSEVMDKCFSSDIPSSTILPDIQGFTAEESTVLSDLLKNFSDLFDGSIDPKGIKCTPLEIPLMNNIPIRQKARPLPPRKFEIANKIFNDLINCGYARISTSSYASPIVLVEKPGKEPRLTGDFSLLNNVTKKIPAKLPLLSELPNFLSKKKYIGKFDLPRAFWQIKMKEEDIPKKAVCIPGRKIEFLRAPFGIANVPAHFQKELWQILRSDHTWLYIDDLIEASTDFEQFVENLTWLFQKCRDYRIKLSGPKSLLTTCEFPIKIVGTVFEGDQRRIDPERIEALAQMPVPRDISTLRSFLGSINWLRDFLPGLSTLTKPLTDLLKKGKKFELTEVCLSNYKKIIESVINSVPLSLPDLDSPIIVTTDASNRAIGGTLWMELPPYKPRGTPLNERNVRPISFYSASLKPEQTKWSTLKQELYAIIRTLTFRPNETLLKSVNFELYTDHKNLTYLLYSPD
ncbi:hypothetical protein RCL1_005708 [Eukaryota sp. TZLM3-RCL]